MRIVSMTIALAAGLAQPGIAFAAPAAAFNKTIKTSFSVTIPAKAADGTMMTGTRIVNKTIYISTAGRVFSSTSRNEGPNANHTEIGPDVTGNTFRFDGNRLVGVLQLGTGASQMIVTFDSGFQTCTTQVVTGGQSGKPMTWKGLSGKMLTATGPATTSNPTCSIQSGNALAG